MRFDEMVMVIVNDKGSETNILTTFEDFTQEFLYPFVSDIEDIVMMIKELSEKQGKVGWTECYKAANKTVGAKYCSGEKELVAFLNGKFNDREDGRFDIDRSSDDCLALLDKCGMIDLAALKKEYGQKLAPDKQGIFEIEVQEILSRVERVPAESLGEAIDRVTERYKNGEIILDENDYKGVDYIPLEVQEKKL